MNDFNQVYEILKRWRERLPNINAITLVLFEDQMRIRFDWYETETRPPAAMTEIIPLDHLKNIRYFANFEDFLLDKVEREYMKFEVGEE